MKQLKIVVVNFFIQSIIDVYMISNLQICKKKRRSFFINRTRIDEKKSEFYSSSKKIRNARNNGFIFNEIVKLTQKLIQFYQI